MLLVCVCYVCESRAPALTLMAADFGLSGPSQSGSFSGKMHPIPRGARAYAVHRSLSLEKIESTRIPNTIIHYTLLCTGYQHNQVHQSTGTARARFWYSGPSQSGSFWKKCTLQYPRGARAYAVHRSLSLEKIESTRIPNTIIHFCVLVR